MARRFRVALTFSGDRRPYVQAVAEALSSALGGPDQVFFDSFHRAELARGNLGALLPKIYLHHADLVVTVIDKGYQSSEWCGLEWNAVLGLLKKKKSEAVLLARFGLVEPDELCGMAGYIDLDCIAAPEFAKQILQRLRLNDSQEKQRRKAPRTNAKRKAKVVWPRVDVRSSWRVANHSDALNALESLLSPNPTFRVLMITGRDGTGKSLVTRILHSSARRLEERLLSGRLDFKGSAQLDGEVAIFAEDLELPIPSGEAGLRGQVSQILFQVKARPHRPTLMVFDTFEASGALGDLLAQNLVRVLERCPNLRIVISGSRLPVFDEREVDGLVGPTIELMQPTPQDWFQYCLLSAKISPELNLENVKIVHKLARGKPAIVSQVLDAAR